MGNWVGKDKGVVHPIDEYEGQDRTQSPNSLMRIKVRMTKRQLKEMMAQVDKSKLGHRIREELGCLILQECLQGRLSAWVVAESDHEVSKYERGWMLSTISEEDEQEHYHLL
ncbi:hypothetical protein M0R45_034069 [Rubus argutus]|uniref:Uncharacterized protein n=1 Tax=Rubus argutus TaxID=59490 RepID=A0AAW1VRI0_RUBAR